jgi:hypothetical protein
MNVQLPFAERGTGSRRPVSDLVYHEDSISKLHGTSPYEKPVQTLYKKKEKLIIYLISKMTRTTRKIYRGYHNQEHLYLTQNDQPVQPFVSRDLASKFLTSREVRHLREARKLASRRRHHSPSRSITAHLFEIMQHRETHGTEPVEIPIAVHLSK